MFDRPMICVVSYICHVLVVYRKTSIKRWVPNNRRVSNKLGGFEANVLINARSQINARVF